MILTAGINASLFNPRMLSVKGWWSAKNPSGNGVIPPDATQLSTLADLSGNGYDWSQATGGAQPTFVANAGGGLPAINFNAQYFTRAYTAALNNTNMSIFIVCSVTTNTGNFRSILTSRRTGVANNGYIFYAEPNTGTNKWSFWIGDGTTNPFIENDGATITLGQLVLLRGFTNVASDSFYVNGTAFNGDSTAYSLNPSVTMYLGTGESNQFPFPGQLRELCIFDYTLTASQQTAMSNYFRLQWGTSIS